MDLGPRSLETRVSQRVMHVRICRPEKRNAMSQAMYRGLKRAAIVADADAELDALCITGTEDVFAVGGDMSGESEDAEGLARELGPTEHFPFRHLERCRKAPHGRFEEVVQSILDAVRRTGPAARAAVKAEMNRRLSAPDANLFKRSILSPEMVEGMKAFLEERDPTWPRS